MTLGDQPRLGATSANGAAPFRMIQPETLTLEVAGRHIISLFACKCHLRLLLSEKHLDLGVGNIAHLVVFIDNLSSGVADSAAGF